MNNVLVSTEWLAEHLGDHRVRVIDVRGRVLPPGNVPRYLAKESEYRVAHVPGAAFVDWTRDFVDVFDPVPAQIAAPDAFAERATALGIGSETHVVAYDDYNHIFASRLAWAFRYYGHDDVSVLDGGFGRWVGEGRVVTTEVPALTRAEPPFVSRPNASLKRDAAQLHAALGRADVLLIDARSPEQYAGETSAARRHGHIPGARNVHYAKLVDPATNRFRSAGEIASVFAAGGVDVQQLPAEVVVYCNGGISCTTTLQALRLLGRGDVAVYDGSWNEWGNDDALPLRVGSSP